MLPGPPVNHSGMAARAKRPSEHLHEDEACPRTVSGLIGAPVRVGDVTVGRVRDVLLNRRLGHVLGFSVRGPGAHTHFLPWIATDVHRDEVAVRSVLSLLSPCELAFYVDNGVGLRGLAGSGRNATDVLVERDGDVVAVVIAPGEAA